MTTNRAVGDSPQGRRVRPFPPPPKRTPRARDPTPCKDTYLLFVASVLKSGTTSASQSESICHLHPQAGGSRPVNPQGKHGANRLWSEGKPWGKPG
jgi:hypothetical protein